MLMLGTLWSCEMIDISETSEPGASTSTSHWDSCYVWNGHIVVSSQLNDDGKTELLLLSLHEWSDMPSTNHVTDSALVRILAEGYQEMELNDWHVPTQDEAKRLREAYSVGSAAWNRLNRILLSNEASGLSEDARYLCNEGRKSFSFASGTTISNAGSKAKSYHLRLMKRVQER